MKRVLISVQVGAALFLVTSGIAIIIFWLICATLSLGASSGLAPWTAAGVQRFGLLFILLAVIPGALGIAWAARLDNQVNTSWAQIIKLMGRLGKFFFLAGAASTILIPVIAAFK
ncbi:hypothetical protein HX794_29400 [Pseudomonas costantinii]|uniref:hypothetical protein n=1 Tax=Pseudomonas costantinii TaxID=168469 RepID=UPI0015A3F873|nr:hypothetical protein [Pseudomonas costantinii]NVZ23769.1 hypothetical protein [Pseudomonas costantinii]